jgi:hypothetical protein
LITTHWVIRDWKQGDPTSCSVTVNSVRSNYFFEKEITMSDEDQQWGIVELMGRKVVAGLIQKSVILGPPMLRIDIPKTSTFPAFTQFYGEAALYCVTFTSEEVATKTAEEVKVNPVSVYVPELVTREQFNEIKERAFDLDMQVRKLKSLPSPQDRDEEDQDEPNF